jgi:hypothetical protein
LDTSQLIDVATLALGISSSAVAVILGIWLTEYFKRRDEQKQTKSLIIAYLDGVDDHLGNIVLVLGFLAGQVSWTEEKIARLPLLMKLIQPTKSVQPIDTTLFDNKIRQNFLKLDSHLVSNVLSHNKYVYQMNFNLTSLFLFITDPPIMKPEDTGSKVTSNFLTKNSTFFRELEKFAMMLAQANSEFKKALLENRKVSIDWTSLHDQSETMGGPSL